MEHKIISIEDNGSVNVKYGDYPEQNISGLTVSDAATLDRELVEYGKAYATGLDAETVVVDPEVRNTVGEMRPAELAEDKRESQTEAK